MNITKFYFAVLAIFSLLFSACDAPLGEEPQSLSFFTATIVDGAATKTVLAPAVNGTSSGEMLRNVLWQAGDRVVVGGAMYTAASGGSTTTMLMGEGAVRDGLVYKAYYPASMYSLSGDGVSLSLPSSQEYGGKDSEERPVIKDLPMYAESETTVLTFKNLCAVLNFKLSGTGTVSKIVLKSTKALWGPFSVSSDAAVIASSATAGDYTTLTLDCTGVSSGGVSLNAAAPTEFCLALPAGNYALNTLQVEIFGPGDTPLVPSFKNASSASDLIQSRIYEIEIQNIGVSATNGRDPYFNGGSIF